MIKTAVIFLTILAQMHIVEAGSKSLTRSQTLTWTFTGTDSISFVYTIPESEGKKYGYWGLGFQPTTTKNMKGDIITVSKKSGVLDTYATGNTKMVKDSKNNLTDTSLTLVGGKYVAKWTRKLDTGDSKDLKLVKGTKYRLIWGFGKESSGKWKEHSKKDYGKDTFTLNDTTQRRLTEEEFELWEAEVLKTEEEEVQTVEEPILIDEDSTSVYMIVSFILLFTYIVA